MKESKLKYYLIGVVVTLLTLSISVDYVKDYLNLDVVSIEMLDGELEEETEKELDDKIIRWELFDCEARRKSNNLNSYADLNVNISKFERTPPTPPPDFM